jgi:hypothetical protein
MADFSTVTAPETAATSTTGPAVAVAATPSEMKELLAQLKGAQQNSLQMAQFLALQTDALREIAASLATIAGCVRSDGRNSTAHPHRFTTTNTFGH